MEMKRTEATGKQQGASKLYWHFGGKNIPTQHQALFALAIAIIARQPQSAQSLVAAFRGGILLPFPVRLHQTEAELLLKYGVAERCFCIDPKTGLHRLTAEYENAYFLRKAQSDQLHQQTRAEFYRFVKTKGLMVTDAASNHVWHCLQRYVKQLALWCIEQSATSKRPPDHESMARIAAGLPPLFAGTNVLEVALETFAPFISRTSAGQQLFSRIFMAVTYATRAAIPKETANELRRPLTRQTLLLDTNLLATLFGLRSNEELTNTRRQQLVSLHRSGMRVAVTTVTVQEFQGMLRRAAKRAENQRLAPGYNPNNPDLRHSVEAAYLAQRHLYTAAEFSQLYGNLPQNLASVLGIPVHVVRLRDSDVNELNKSPYAAEIAGFMDFATRQQEAAQYDLTNLAFVLRERRQNVHQTYWFVTEHTLVATLFRNGKHRNNTPFTTKLEWLYAQHLQLFPRVHDVTAFVSSAIYRNWFYPVPHPVNNAQTLHEHFSNSGPVMANGVVAQILASTPATSMRKALRYHNAIFGITGSFSGPTPRRRNNKRPAKQTESADPQDDPDEPLQGKKIAALLATKRCTQNSRSDLLQQQVNQQGALQKLKARKIKAKNIVVYATATCTLLAIALPHVLPVHSALVASLSALSVLLGSVLSNRQKHFYNNVIASQQAVLNHLEQQLATLREVERQTNVKLRYLIRTGTRGGQNALG